MTGKGILVVIAVPFLPSILPACLKQPKILKKSCIFLANADGKKKLGRANKKNRPGNWYSADQQHLSSHDSSQHNSMNKCSIRLVDELF